MPTSPQQSNPRAKQVGALLSIAKGDIWEVPVLLATTLATRRSETLALDWNNVDLDKRVVRIERSLQRKAAGQPVTLLGLKTERARRAISLPKPVVERLRQHRADQVKQRLELGPAWQTITDEHGNEVDLVCRGGDGKPLSPDEFSKAFKKIAAKAGFDPRTRLHDCRHALLTELGRKKVHPVIISALAGHSTPAFTMAVYQHAWEEGAEGAAAVIGASLGL